MSFTLDYIETNNELKHRVYEGHWAHLFIEVHEGFDDNQNITIYAGDTHISTVDMYDPDIEIANEVMSLEEFVENTLINANVGR